MDTLKHKGYTGSVEYSETDNCLYGKVLGMSKDLISYEGTTLAELRADFEAGVDDYLAGCEAHGIEPRKPYSGSFNVRVPQDLHSKLALLAAERGETLNAFVRHSLELAVQ